MTARNATIAVWVAASFIMSLRFIPFLFFVRSCDANFVVRLFLADAQAFEVSTYDASIISMSSGIRARRSGL
jgi:hypothetical protein